MKHGIYYSYWEHEWSAKFGPYIEKVAKLGFDIIEVAAEVADEKAVRLTTWIFKIIAVRTELTVAVDVVGQSVRLKRPAALIDHVDETSHQVERIVEDNHRRPVDAILR